MMKRNHQGLTDAACLSLPVPACPCQLSCLLLQGREANTDGGQEFPTGNGSLWALTGHRGTAEGLAVPSTPRLPLCLALLCQLLL